MKQCIMSESRFDFLRELVSSVPDINVEEQQLMNQSCSAGGSVSDPDEESPPHNPIVSYALASNAMTSLNPLTGKANASTIDASVNYSTKTPPYTAHPPYFETVGRSLMMNKQQSLDLTLSSSSSATASAELRPLSTAPANYYTEIKSDDTNDESDVSPPKIARLNSAPVYGLSRTAPCTPADFSATPIINFDFTKGLPTSYTQTHQPSPTAFVKIDYNPTATAPASSSSSSTPMPRISVNVLGQNNNAPVMPPVNYSRSIVVQNASATPNINTKLAYHHVNDMKNPSPSSPSSSSSSFTAAVNSRQLPVNVRPVKDHAKVPAPRGRPPKPRFASAPTLSHQVVVDLTNTHSSSSAASSFTVAVRAAASSSPSPSASASTSSSSNAAKANGFTLPAPPTFFAASATSSCLDMDEDYDTI